MIGGLPGEMINAGRGFILFLSLCVTFYLIFVTLCNFLSYYVTLCHQDLSYFCHFVSLFILFLSLCVTFYLICVTFCLIELSGFILFLSRLVAFYFIFVTFVHF